MSVIINSAKQYFSDDTTRFVFLDGNFCKNLQNCYLTLTQQLSIPSYFGNNLDALDEVLSDLDWITEKKIKIIILNKADLLKEDLQKKDLFLSVLNKSENDKVKIIYLAENVASNTKSL